MTPKPAEPPAAEPSAIQRSAAELVELCTQRGISVSCAESLTGGLVGAALVAVPGASQVLRGAVVAYHRELKERMLGVPSSLIDSFSVVSPEVAMAMALGVRAATASEWAVATTGVAGPGAHDGVAAGTVVIAVVGPAQQSVTTHHFSGGRDQVRHEATSAALAALLAAI